jgi:hypothetical protein
MVKQHQMFLKYEVYLVGKLANAIWAWRLGCKILLEQLNQNVIYEGDSWYVQGEFKGVKNHQTCVHIDGAFIQLDST